MTVPSHFPGQCGVSRCCPVQPVNAYSPHPGGDCAAPIRPTGSGHAHAVLGDVLDFHRIAGYPVDHGRDRAGCVYHTQIFLTLKLAVSVGPDGEEQLAGHSIDDLDPVARPGLALDLELASTSGFASHSASSITGASSSSGL